jgi:hypothetical protein
VQRAAAETPVVASERITSAPADTPAEKIKTALMKHGDEAFVTLLNQNPEVVAHVYPNGWTLLEEAAFVGSLPAVEALLRQGADPEPRQATPTVAGTVRRRGSV